MGDGIMLHRVMSAAPRFTFVPTNPNAAPGFTYINDGHGNWRIKFLTSGTLTFQSTLSHGIDVFLVGGGALGGSAARAPSTSAYGGGSGYTTTDKTGNIKPVRGTAYSITVGAAGISGHANGYDSTAFGKTAGGGKAGSAGYHSDPYTEEYNYAWADGGNGGSGGGADAISPTGGSDGYNGSAPGSHMTAGKGQRNKAGPNGETGTTREFGESSGELYAQGGGKTTPYKANSGNGGCVYWTYPTTVTIAASSGIVVIRNHRE